MAGKRKRSRKGSKKMKTTAVCKSIPLEVVATGQSNYVLQTPKALGVMNHRLYREGMIYDMSLSAGRIDFATTWKIYTLPDTWFVRGAINYAFRSYRASLQEELTLSGGKHSKWLDFRINEQDPDGTWGYMQPSLFDGDSHAGLTTSGYTESVVTNAAGTEIGWHLFGTVSNSYNIFEEYANHIMGRRADDSAESGPSGYEGLSTGAADSDRIYEDGDVPPYTEAFDGVFSTGDFLVLQDEIGQDADGWAKFNSRSFRAPLGLVFLVASTEAAATLPQLILHCSPGKYKGVKAEELFNFRLLGSTAKSLR